MKTVRLTTDDAALAKALFAMMARVFDEPPTELGDSYVAGLLRRPDFWAIAAIDDQETIGGLTAHTLPMTRAAVSEIFIYDIAVRTDRQRQGIGRQLITHLRDAAAAQGIHELFVAADNADGHALDFYRALGACGSPVTFFSFARNR